MDLKVTSFLFLVMACQLFPSSCLVIGNVSSIPADPPSSPAPVTDLLMNDGPGRGMKKSADEGNNVLDQKKDPVPDSVSGPSVKDLDSAANVNETSVKSDGLPACPWFTCANGRCLISAWRCDQTDDCGDNSDEVGCENMICDQDMFRCGSGMCIARSWMCDSYKDCPNGEDEDNC